MCNYSKQAERNAIEAYVLYGVRIVLPLSSSARKELARMRRSVAGLRELHAVAHMQRGVFETTDAYTQRMLRTATEARATEPRVNG